MTRKVEALIRSHPPLCSIQGRVSYGENVKVSPFCVLGSDHGPLHIPAGSTIRSHTIIEGGTTFNGPVETGHHCLIRHGNTVGTHFRLGSYSSIEGGMVIGDYVRLLGRFQAGTQNLDPPVRIGDFVTCYSGVMMADNQHPGFGPFQPPEICDGAVLGMGAFVLPNVRIGVGAVIAAQAVVSRSVPDATVLFRDGRSKFVDELVSADGRRGPWTGYTGHGYPDETQSRIDELHSRILSAIERMPSPMRLPAVVLNGGM